MFRSTLAFLACLFACIAAVAAQEIPTRGDCDWGKLPQPARNVASRARSLVNDGKVASFSFAIASDGKIVCEQSYGWADRERQVAATPFTPYAAGSVAKSFTGTAIYLLVQRGLLKMTDTPEQHRVEVKNFTQLPITIGKLLTMTAGVPHGWFYAAGGPFDQQQILQRYAIAALPAGKSFDYSNFSFGVLGEIVAKTSSKTYDSFLSDEVLRPLKLTSVSFEPRPAGTAKGYHEGKNLWPTYQFYPEAAGGLYASVHDLALYGMFHLGTSAEVLNPGALTQIHQAPTSDASGTGYRAGWAHLQLGSDRLWLSNGEVNAGAATLVILPQKHVVIACALNTPGDWADETAMQFADAFSPGLLDKFAETRKRFETAHAPRPFAASAEYEGSWKGWAEVPDTHVPVELIFHGNSATISIGKVQAVEVKDLHFESGRLVGQASTSLNLPDLGSDNTVQFELERESERLAGILRAMSKGNSPGYGLPVYVSLSRKR